MVATKHASNDLVNKQKAPASAGHNMDKLKVDYVRDFANLEKQIIEIRGQQKDMLNDAKSDGILKTAIRGAAKNLFKTDEQKQAQKEVDDETDYITALCKDLPLFKAA